VGASLESGEFAVSMDNPERPCPKNKDKKKRRGADTLQEENTESAR
jgi:hypothetical protein